MITVAIDGPSGVGKSSTSRALAEHFGYAYFDTGAMYRAATWWCLTHGENLDNVADDPQAQERITELVARFFTEEHCDISFDPSNQIISSDGEDLSEIIRSKEIASHVAQLAAIVPVRHILIAAQRAYITAQENPQSFSNGAGIVVEGRDITGVVAPDAEVKIILTAREDVRQARRNKQNGLTASDKAIDTVAARDASDAKNNTSFTEPGEGVVVVDNSDMSFEQTLQILIDMVDNAIDEQLFGAYVDNLNEYELEEGDEQYLTGEDLTENDDEDEADYTVGVLAVVGRPNVGKSTLVNRILGRRAAIVEDTPGVTRDRVTYDAEWAGTRFQLVDTGGWEADVEGIDSAIASQAQVAVQLADAVLLVVDGAVGLTASDERIVSILRAAGKPVVVAVNKLDTQMSEYQAAEFWNLGLGEPYPISAMHGRGVGDLLDVALQRLTEAEKTSGLLTPSHLRRVALVGRPNVGKSSLLNQLSGENRAVVSDIAGTTRDPVDEVVNVGGEDWLFIDTAGIKRRLHKQSGADYYSSLRTQAAIERAELALVLFDVSVPISDQDLKVMSQAVDAGRAVVLIFNKWDLLDDFGRQRIERLWATEFNRVTWAQRINLSAKTGWHTNRLKLAMDTALENWDKRVSTGRLNSFLGQIQAAHPHPLRGGKQPRILFATQASTRPPRFVIFTTGFLDHSYRRFIEHSLRDEFGFEGTPIQISVNVREKKKRK